MYEFIFILIVIEFIEKSDKFICNFYGIFFIFDEGEGSMGIPWKFEHEEGGCEGDCFWIDVFGDYDDALMFVVEEGLELGEDLDEGIYVEGLL